MLLTVLLLAIHLLAAVFWVGGMAFAYWMLRPAAGALEQSQRRFLDYAGVDLPLAQRLEQIDAHGGELHFCGVGARLL